MNHVLRVESSWTLKGDGKGKLLEEKESADKAIGVQKEKGKYLLLSRLIDDVMSYVIRVASSWTAKEDGKGGILEKNENVGKDNWF